VDLIGKEATIVVLGHVPAPTTVIKHEPESAPQLRRKLSLVRNLLQRVKFDRLKLC
jgi:hypothetical protein